MELHRGRILGIILGIVILATIFLVPFGTGSQDATLYGAVGPVLSDLGGLQASGDSAAIVYGYIWVVAFILLVIAGLVGIFPLGTGVLGVVGMAMITAAPFLVYPSGQVALSTGAGFFVIWIASIASLAASFWHWKKKAGPEVTVNVTQSQTPANTPPKTQVPP
ncbi:MAG: hypothetical protein HY296_04930 [Thaumarchaeota archaeon]|nr:hypothetical protein [Nitrososphaerota archaeon]